MTNTSISLSNHPFLLKEEGLRFRDVPAEVRMMSASSWLLYFIHWVSGWLPLNKSSRRRKDFELQCCISNDNFLPIPFSHSFPCSLFLSLQQQSIAELNPFHFSRSVSHDPNKANKLKFAIKEQFGSSYLRLASKVFGQHFWFTPQAIIIDIF